MTQSNGYPGFKTWNRKKTLMKRLVKYKLSLQFIEQYCTNANFLVLMNVPRICKMLTLGEAWWKIYRNSTVFASFL